ncbi:DUF1835 domain-containing protein [Neobacillus niacini]|uniref:DUF1835 domain-containing protein n=1 Tax=Neobacillus niacini TaxID=86668 RepID=UPI0005EF5855|nr:DUF1835 domain-containing protein [Neobacillus niacini]
MIHVLFGASAAGSFKFTLKEMGLDKKEKVISFWDMFSIGPIWQLHEDIGVKSRFEWMKGCIGDEFVEYLDYTQRFEKTIQQLKSIPQESHIFIWSSESAHEQTGLRYIIYLLKGNKMDFTVINTTKAYEELLRVKKLKYTPLHTGEIPPEKLQIIYEQDYGKFLSDHDKEDLEKEWLTISESQETLRIWRNGRIHGVSEDYYDEFIIKKAKKLHSKQKSTEFMKSARLIGEVIGHLDEYVGDTFIEYRLKKLIEAGVFEVEGNLEAMRFYSVRYSKTNSTNQ